MSVESLCPLCWSDRKSFCKSIDVELLEAEWQRNWGISIREELHGHAKLELYRCEECLVEFFIPGDVAGSARLYEQLEKFDWYYMPEKWEHHAALEDLSGFKKVLEVGCGFGDFLALGRKRGFGLFEGMEQNASAVQRAVDNGLAVRMQDIEEAASERPGQYDAVCAFQVLEHIANPRSFLEAAAKLLHSKGKLILGLPNADSFLRYQFNLLDMPPHHVTRWSTETLRRMTKWLPLRLERVRWEPLAEYHVDGYVEAQVSRFAGAGGIAPAVHRARPYISALMRKSGLHRLMRGQSLYACYEKTGL